MSMEPRIDARDKVTGQAKYIDDLPELPGMAYGAVSSPRLVRGRGVALFQHRLPVMQDIPEFSIRR